MVYERQRQALGTSEERRLLWDERCFSVWNSIWGDRLLVRKGRNSRRKEHHLLGTLGHYVKTFECVCNIWQPRSGT